MLPLGRQSGMPDLLAVAVVFWNVHQPRRVGVGVAFLLGLLMDVHQGALMGQHALAYTLLSFVAITVHRRLLWFGVVEQALQILPLFVAGHVVVAAGAPAGWGHLPGLVAVAGAAARSLALATGHVVAAAPQRRAPDPDSL
jgi:rod shape-determining protein MreD